MRTVDWNYDNQTLRMIDQRLLPEKLVMESYSDHASVASAIRDMVVRGAPAIGAAGAFGLALAGFQSQARSTPNLVVDLENAAVTLGESRPTAVNLSWAINRILDQARIFSGGPEELRLFVLEQAQHLADEDVETNRRMALHGAVLINDGDTVIHHCNTGSLATVEWGTALGVIRTAHDQGKHVHVLVDETRPRLQGSRLTAWELDQYGIPYEIITDNMAGYFLKSGQVKSVFFGGDRVAANGDVANKIGTYMLALSAHDNSVPVYSVVPTSTIDLSLEQGDLIPIEERSTDEVLNIQLNGVYVAPMGAKARNPAFDVTPSRLISAFVTENGIVYPPFENNLKKVVK
jgi:methylthioribose-1-phosphate isomerase